MVEVRIPNDWDPRSYQLPFWLAMEGGKKRAAVVWPRRAGKDSVALNYLMTQALGSVGTFYYFAPTLTQIRKIVWQGIDKEGRRIIDGRMFTGNLVCRCGEVLSEGWMPAHMRNNHGEEPEYVPYRQELKEEDDGERHAVS